MNGIAELAKLLKDRENSDDYSPVIGKIIALPIVKISVGPKILLTAKDLKMCVKLTHNENESDIGKEVVLLPYEKDECGYQKFILIGVLL